MSWVFGYGSLVAPEAAMYTLRRPVAVMPAELHGWRRRWSLLRYNRGPGENFVLADDSVPEYVVGLNVEGGCEDPAGPVNGGLIEVDDDELRLLDQREIRYDRVEVTSQIGRASVVGTVVTYTAKRPQHFALEPPPNSIIVESYLAAVIYGFDQLGEGELEHFNKTTGSPPTEVAQAGLGEFPPGIAASDRVR